MTILNIIAMILLLIGGVTWGILGICSFNIVEFICCRNRIATRIIYILVFISALWLIISWIMNGAILFAM